MSRLSKTFVAKLTRVSRRRAKKISPAFPTRWRRAPLYWPMTTLSSPADCVENELCIVPRCV
jgi:hypothetical protein